MTTPEKNLIFLEAFEAWKEQLLAEDHSDALEADGPFSIYGGNTVKGQNTQTEGQIYRTKDKKVLVVFFPGILAYDPPKFGHAVLFSSGGPNSTIKSECPEGSLPDLLTDIKEATTADPSVKDATPYHEQFLMNVAVECGFGMGLYIPALFDKPFVVVVPSTEDELPEETPKSDSDPEGIPQVVEEIESTQNE